MTLAEGVVVLTIVFGLLGLHNAIGRLLRLLDGHLERFQGKLDVLVVSQDKHNQKLDVILGKLL